MRPAGAGPREGMTAASGIAAPEDFRTLRQRTEPPDPSSPRSAFPAAPIIGSRPPASRTPDGAASGGRATTRSLTQAAAHTGIGRCAGTAGPARAAQVGPLDDFGNA